MYTSPSSTPSASAAARSRNFSGGKKISASVIGKKLKIFLPTVFLVAFAVLFSVFPDRYMPACLKGIEIWALNVLPAVFPFLFVTSLLRAGGGAKLISRAFSPFSKAVFGCGGEGGFCFFIGILSGYPVGAATVAGLKKDGLLSDGETRVLACACSTSGPLFAIGSVGAGMFSDKKIGFFILAANLFAALLSGIILRFFFLRRSPATPAPAAKEETREFSLSSCVQNSVLSALAVGGCIAFFYVLAAMLADFKILAPLQSLFGAVPALASCAEGLSKGLVEVTSGCLSLAASGNFLAAPCCAFLVTLGGASILFQQIAYLRGVGIKAPVFLFVKLLQAFAAFFICLLFVSL